MIEQKRSAVFGFVGGTLEINLSGYGAQNGAGRFTFDEDDLQWQQHDEKSGAYVEIKVARSEMVELRDWITARLVEQQDDEQGWRDGWASAEAATAGKYDNLRNPYIDWREEDEKPVAGIRNGVGLGLALWVCIIVILLGVWWALT